MLTDLEKKIIASIQEDMAVTARPYLKISEKLGISEETLLETLRDLCERGIIRRFGATTRKPGLPPMPWLPGRLTKTALKLSAAVWRHLNRCPIATAATPRIAGPTTFIP